MTSRFIRSGILSAIVILAGCDGTSPLTTAPAVPSPTAPSLPPPPSPLANWRANATVIGVTNPGRACGWGTSAGETRAGVDWRITIAGDSIVLEEDMPNWPTDHIPFSGTLRGQQFTATYTTRGDYLQWACQFKGATLSGRFSQDLSSFEALEELSWGPPGNETTVQRRWIGSRL